MDNEMEEHMLSLLQVIGFSANEALARSKQLLHRECQHCGLVLGMHNPDSAQACLAQLQRRPLPAVQAADPFAIIASLSLANLIGDPMFSHAADCTLAADHVGPCREIRA